MICFLNHNNSTIEFRLTETNIHIVDSYKIKKKDDMIAILASIRKDAAALGYHYKRSDKSWLKEWRSHNLLYDLGIEEDRTDSVDLSEKESRFRLFAYNILTYLYR